MAAINRGFGTGNPPAQNYISTKQGMVMHMNRTKKFGFFGVVAYIVLACVSFVPAFLFDFTAPALLSRTTGSILCVCLLAVLIAWCTFAKVKSSLFWSAGVKGKGMPPEAASRDVVDLSD